MKDSLSERVIMTRDTSNKILIVMIIAAALTSTVAGVLYAKDSHDMLTYVIEQGIALGHMRECVDVNGTWYEFIGNEVAFCQRAE